MFPKRPVVLSVSGHDPTGGAGIQADIEVLFRLGCHPCTVVTSLTAQDTCNVRRIYPQDPQAFLEQALTVMDDLPPVVIKIGLLGAATLAIAVARILERAPQVPVVFDPVLAAGGGYEFAGEELVTAVRESLLGRVDIVTPNTPEARRLTGMEVLDTCAAKLMDFGCRNVLITGTHDDSDDVVNRLYRSGAVRCYRWPRLPNVYHGSGCTLAAAIAGFLALGCSIDEAVERGQAETWRSLHAAYALGGGQFLPDRRVIELR